MKRHTESDPVIKEIHAIREAHAAEFGYDLKAMFDDAIQKGKLEKHRVVSLHDMKHQRTKMAASVMDSEEQYR